MWEAVFMLLVLKIPVVYLGLVIWWAIRADPKPEEPVFVAAVTDTPPAAGPLAARDRRFRRGPERPGPARRPPRGRLTHRAEARR